MISVRFKSVASAWMCRRWIMVLPMLLAVALSGCQTPTRSNLVEQPSRQVREPGYTVKQRYAVTGIHETWSLGDDTLDVTLLRPSGHGPFPLIVYLPGLGEPSNGGAAWRQAWAQAGYVVVAFQLPGSSEFVWHSPKARSGDFRDLAMEQYARDALAKRLAVLHRLFDELERRRSSGELASVDDSRIALAGFDLGAQTVMAAAGEAEEGHAPFALPATVKCIVAFSPYASFSGTAFDRRFAAISVPVMSVTSAEDVDPMGVVTSPELRRAPFENMPSGHKYLLSLAGASHALVGGMDTPAATAQTRQDSAGAQGKDDARRDSAGGRRKGGNPGMQGSRRGGARDSDADGSSGSQLVSAAAWTAELGLAQTVTTAYLDAFMKDNAVAKEWLAKDARRWLADSGDLAVK
jgi:dienelactone hydrolase